MRLHLVTETYKFFSHFVQHIQGEHTRMCLPFTGLQESLCYVLLLLEKREPAEIKLIPELKSAGMKLLVITQNS